jgi:hypothetical protein
VFISSLCYHPSEHSGRKRQDKELVGITFCLTSHVNERKFDIPVCLCWRSSGNDFSLILTLVHLIGQEEIMDRQENVRPPGGDWGRYECSHLVLEVSLLAFLSWRRAFKTQCTQDGSWQEGACVPVTCDPPPPKFHGLYQCTNDFQFNSECRIKCEDSDTSQVSPLEPDQPGP